MGITVARKINADVVPRFLFKSRCNLIYKLFALLAHALRSGISSAFVMGPTGGESGVCDAPFSGFQNK